MTGERGEGISDGERRRIAEAVKAACIQAALSGFEEAGVSGLCHEGALEYALDAIRMLDVETVIDSLPER